MSGQVLASAIFYGLCLGSFLNVCIYRLPRDLSLVRPGSRCPHCHKAIRWFDNIPVLSYLLLGGKCRNCKKRISWRYPATEAAVAALCVLMAWRWEAAGLWAAVAAISAGVLLAITIIDWETFLIPDPLSVGLLTLALATAPINPLLEGDAVQRLLYAFIGGLVGFALTWLTAYFGEKAFGQEALGGGDVKLLTAVGALTGGTGAFTTLMIGSLFGAAYGLWEMGRGRLERRQPIPFGPFLSLGALITLLGLLPPGFPFFLTF